MTSGFIHRVVLVIIGPLSCYMSLLYQVPVVLIIVRWIRAPLCQYPTFGAVRMV
jgi:hypothetical protein